MLHFHLKACSKCHGDLALDEGDWLCLQCGTYYYIGLYRKPLPLLQTEIRPETRIEGPSGDRSEKALFMLTSAVHGLPSMAITAPGFGGLPEFEIRPSPASTCRFGETTAIGLGSGDHYQS